MKDHLCILLSVFYFVADDTWIEMDSSSYRKHSQVIMNCCSFEARISIVENVWSDRALLA